MDVAASEFYTEDKKYDLDFKNDNNDKSKIITGCAPAPGQQPVCAGRALRSALGVSNACFHSCCVSSSHAAGLKLQL